jgi:hypothetical protein
MSLGYIGYCKKIEEDEQAVVYAYSGADINDENRGFDADKAYDGVLWIDKSILSWPRDKTKKQKESVPWTFEAIEEGVACVLRPCKNSFFRGSNKNTDYIAYRCFDKIFQRIFHGEAFPETERFIQ